MSTGIPYADEFIVEVTEVSCQLSDLYTDCNETTPAAILLKAKEREAANGQIQIH